MTLQTVSSYAVCANHVHMIEAYDAMRTWVDTKQAVAIVLEQRTDPLHFCGCGKPGLWLLRAVRIEPGHYVEAEVDMSRGYAP